MIASTLETEQFDNIAYTVSFYKKKERNNFNLELKNYLNSNNILVKDVSYNDYYLPVIEENDKKVKSYDIRIVFCNKDDMKKTIKKIRKEFKGYYE